MAENFAKTRFALEMPVKIGDNYPCVLREYWGEKDILDPVKFFKKLQNKAKSLCADFVSVYFNVECEDEIENAKAILKDIVQLCEMPLAIRGSGQKNLDSKLLPELIPFLKAGSIVASAQDTNYKNVVNEAIKGGHAVVLRTPIDINLTKELNILTTDIGLKPQNILMDPDMGCVGYGLDYGYSIIERIGLAKDAGDTMLDMPIIVYTGEESFKAKESKSDDFSASWGDLNTRSVAWELATTTSLICAGANTVVAWHPTVVETLKEVLC